MSGIVNKVKEVLHKDHTTTHSTASGHSTATGHNTSGVPEGTAGPHSTRVAK